MARAILKPQRSNPLLWICGLFIPMVRDCWITIGRTIYHPDGIDPLHPTYAVVREHEMIHVRQYKRMGLLWYVLFYLFVPGGRWRLEREAYLHVNIRRFGYLPEMATEFCSVSPLGSPWGRRAMLRWFRKHAEHL